MSVTLDTRKATQITLACGNNVIIDADDEHIVRSRKWRYRKGSAGLPYVTANTDKHQLYLHRVIMGAKHGQIIDHINGDRLDNRRSNLRFATIIENARNRKPHSIEGKTSRFKGVSQFKSTGKWRALIRDGTKQIYLGQFETEPAAAFAYDMASISIHGDFGRRNFLPLCG